MALFPDDEDEVALEHDSGVIFFMTRVTQVVDPATSSSVAAPDDLIAWLGKHPDLGAKPPRSVNVAGLSGRTLVIHTGSREIETFAYVTGNIRMPPDFTAQLYVLPMEGPDLTVIVGSPTKGWDKAVPLAAPVLASLQVGGAG